MSASNNKTMPTKLRVSDYFATITEKQRKKDCLKCKSDDNINDDGLCKERVCVSMNKKNVLKFLNKYIKIFLLPLLFVEIFVLQNSLFALWLDIYSEQKLQLVASAFGLGMILYGPSALLRQRKKYWYLFAVSTFVSIIFLVEFLYYSYAGGFLQFSSFKFIGQLGSVSGTALLFVQPKLIIFLSGPIIASGLTIFSIRHHKIPAQFVHKHEFLIAVSIIVLFVFGGYQTLFAMEKQKNGNINQLLHSSYDQNGLVGKIGVVHYLMQDAFKRIFLTQKLTDADRQFLSDWNAKREMVQDNQANFGIAKGRNLILIYVESLENVVIGAKLGEEEITPTLNALKKEGLYYSRYYAHNAGGSTADAEFTTLNSLYPTPDAVPFVESAQHAYRALPELLVENGYGTHIFHGDKASFWNRANIYPRLGYQQLFMIDSFTKTREVGITGLGDADFFEQSFPLIKKLEQPFMASLITLDSHTPFVLPSDLNTLTVPERHGLTSYQIDYLQSVHSSDREIGRFLENLKQTSLYQDSVIVVVGDHAGNTDIAQVLGEKEHVAPIWQKEHVPLFIVVPGTDLRGEQAFPASHLDLYPTIAHLLGIEVPRSALGQNLLNTREPIVVRRKGGHGGIDGILGSDQAYIASQDGVFEHGRCVIPANQAPLPMTDCRKMYKEQSDIARVSDIVVRFDLVPMLE